VTLDEVNRVAKRLFDPARLTVVVAGTPVEGKTAPQTAKPPVRPAPAPQVPPQAAAPVPAPATQGQPKPVETQANKSIVKPAAKAPPQQPRP